MHIEGGLPSCFPSFRSTQLTFAVFVVPTRRSAAPISVRRGATRPGHVPSVATNEISGPLTRVSHRRVFSFMRAVPKSASALHARLSESRLMRREGVRAAQRRKSMRLPTASGLVGKESFVAGRRQFTEHDPSLKITPLRWT